MCQIRDLILKTRWDSLGNDELKLLRDAIDIPRRVRRQSFWLNRTLQIGAQVELARRGDRGRQGDKRGDQVRIRPTMLGDLEIVRAIEMLEQFSIDNELPALLSEIRATLLRIAMHRWQSSPNFVAERVHSDGTPGTVAIA